MTRKEFFEHLADFYERCQSISQAKNQDYAQDEDPFQNFRIMDWLGIYGVKEAILGRIAEKLVRIANVIKAGKYEVKDEPPGETLHDLANLSAILQIFMDFEEVKPTKKRKSKANADGIVIKGPWKRGSITEKQAQEAVRRVCGLTKKDREEK